MKKYFKSICNCRGSAYIDTVVLVLCAMLVLALAVQVLPVFVAKQQLDIGLFGGFGSVPITLRAVAGGKSEVYHR